jgi:two-component system chemotaxis response regulator CheB
VSDGRIRVLVIDDSAYHRRTLVKIIDGDPHMEVVGTARDGKEGIKMVVSLDPDLVTLDLEMPRMDGFTFLRWLMKNFPRPVLVVTSRESNRSVFKALDLGAVDFVVKPVKYASIRLGAIEEQVLTKIREVAFLQVDDLPAKLSALAEKIPPPAVKAPARSRFRLVAIGASTGGPPALQSILTGLPRGLPVAVLISQHMPESFTRLFSERLDRLVGMDVSEAADGDAVEKGRVLIAPGGKHLLLDQDREGQVKVRLVRAGQKDRYTPSIDMMMSSAAGIYHDRMMAVLLTGMGHDGIEGMREVKKQKGLTVAESEQTCIVYGMPREAVRSGVVDRILPLSKIGETIVRECSGSRG